MERFKHLRELEDFKEKEVFWEDRMLHHTIDPTKEESFQVIKSLLNQYMINFSSDKFNINDEWKDDRFKNQIIISAKGRSYG